LKKVVIVSAQQMIPDSARWHCLPTETFLGMGTLADLKIPSMSEAGIFPSNDPSKSRKNFKLFHLS
jgi:hypothetical protein